MQTVYFYSTSGCHLCDIAWEMLAPLVSRLPLRLEEIEIADSDELVACYGVRIPVIKFADANADLGWPFSESEALDYFQRMLKQ